MTRDHPADPTVTPAQTRRDDDNFEVTLRPKKLAEYIGQSSIKEHLLVHMGAARKRSDALGHTLLHGPPGLGKTTLAHIVAQEMGSNLRVTSGPAIEKPGDLASLLTNLEEGDVLFIDEVHRMRPVIEEVLYSAMEDFVLDIMIGKGPTARSVRLDLKPFTLVGATTKIGAISAPLRDRFLHDFRLQFYSDIEMEQIVERTATILDLKLQDGVASSLAPCCRATPRIANRLMRSVRDFAQVEGEEVITSDRVAKTLESLGVDQEGLDTTDRAILVRIIDHFAGGPVGLSTLAASMSEETETIEDVYEPYLIQNGFLQRTAKGRVVTERGYGVVGREVSTSPQESLL